MSAPLSPTGTKEARVHRSNIEEENASLSLVGVATAILEWAGVRLMIDMGHPFRPLSVQSPERITQTIVYGHGVNLGATSHRTSRSDPTIHLHELQRVDMILLSHCHLTHHNQEVEASLRRDIPVITTPHAKEHLTSKALNETYKKVHALDFFESMLVGIAQAGDAEKKPAFKVTSIPGKHVPPGPSSVAHPMEVRPASGWMLELGYTSPSGDHFSCGYRIYISGDTLTIDELEEFPGRWARAGKPFDLMLVRLEGTAIPGHSVPLLLATMDAMQGIELIQLVQSGITIPAHDHDNDVSIRSLQDFKAAVEDAGLSAKVMCVDWKAEYRFQVR